MSTSGIKEELFGLTSTGHCSNLYIVETIGDGSCFFHSVLRAFSKTYIESNSVYTRGRIGYEFRCHLSEFLVQKSNVEGKTYYDLLGEGQYEEFDRNIREALGEESRYSLKAMISELKSYKSVDHAYIEVVEMCLNISIYLISAKTGLPYIICNELEKHSLKRNSLIIYYSENPGHYSLIVEKFIEKENDSNDFSIQGLFNFDDTPILNYVKDVIDLTGK